MNKKYERGIAMSLIKAKNNYFGFGGSRRMNCAEAIMDAFKETFNIDEKTAAQFSAFGGGRAPEGVCGAYFAAKTLLEKNGEYEKINELQKVFTEKAGSLKCKEIKSGRKLPCAECVCCCAEYLENKTR